MDGCISLICQSQCMVPVYPDFSGLCYNMYVKMCDIVLSVCSKKKGDIVD